MCAADRCLLVTLALMCACGRIDFDPRGDGRGPDGDTIATTIAQQAYIKASNTNANDQFGWALGSSADGSALAVGARGESSNGTSQSDNSLAKSGAAYVFTRSGVTWSQRAYLKASN